MYWRFKGREKHICNCLFSFFNSTHCFSASKEFIRDNNQSCFFKTKKKKDREFALPLFYVTYDFQSHWDTERDKNTFSGARIVAGM